MPTGHSAGTKKRPLEDLLVMKPQQLVAAALSFEVAASETVLATVEVVKLEPPFAVVFAAVAEFVVFVVDDATVVAAVAACVAVESAAVAA